MKTYIAPVLYLIFFCTATVSAGMDDASLKAWLTTGFSGDGGMSWEKVDSFKEQFAVTDEQLYRVLMEIYRESEDKLHSLAPKTVEWRDAQQIEIGVVDWLSECGDIPVKVFLLDYAASREKGAFAREIAVSSFLRVADAEETKDVLLRFLVGEERMDSINRIGLYCFAKRAYEDSATPEKKTAILNSLIVAACSEEGKIEFTHVDGILAEKSAAYRHSRERLALLERHSQEPPTANLYTDRDLKAALAESRSYKQHLSVNTNLAVLKSQDFNLSQPDLSTNGVSKAVRGSAGAESKTAGAARRGLGRYACFGLPVLLLLGLGVWRLMRRG